MGSDGGKLAGKRPTGRLGRIALGGAVVSVLVLALLVGAAAWTSRPDESEALGMGTPPSVGVSQPTGDRAGGCWRGPLPRNGSERGTRRLNSGRCQSPTPEALVDRVIRDEDAGYEVTVPGSWTEFDVGRVEGVRFFWISEHASTTGHMPVTISIGTPDGDFMLCQFGCKSARATTLAELEEALVSAPSPSGLRYTEEHESTTLGGEPARIERVTGTGGTIYGPWAFYRIYALHEGRPVVLTFDHWSIREHQLTTATIHRIAASLKFLESPRASSTSRPLTPSLRHEVNQSAGYAMDIPAEWRTVPRTGLSQGQSITDYQVPVSPTSGMVGMSVSVGDRYGNITLCGMTRRAAGNNAVACRSFRVTSLDGLQALLRAIDSRAGKTEHRNYLLGGEPGRLDVPHQRPGFTVCIADQQYHAYSIHGGRPVVVTIPYCRQGAQLGARQGKLAGVVGTILESFSFADRE